MGTVFSLTVKLEDLLAHLLRGEPTGRYELACPPYWDEDEGPGVLVVVLKDKSGGQVRSPTDEEVGGAIKASLRTHRNVIFGDSSIGTVEIQEVAVGRKWEKRPQFAGWIRILFKAASGQTTVKEEKNENGGSGRDSVIRVSFGPRG